MACPYCAVICPTGSFEFTSFVQRIAMVGIYPYHYSTPDKIWAFLGEFGDEEHLLSIEEASKLISESAQMLLQFWFDSVRPLDVECWFESKGDHIMIRMGTAYYDSHLRILEVAGIQELRRLLQLGVEALLVGDNNDVSLEGVDWLGTVLEGTPIGFGEQPPQLIGVPESRVAEVESLVSDLEQRPIDYQALGISEADAQEQKALFGAWERQPIEGGQLFLRIPLEKL